MADTEVNLNEAQCRDCKYYSNYMNGVCDKIEVENAEDEGIYAPDDEPYMEFSTSDDTGLRIFFIVPEDFGCRCFERKEDTSA